MKEITTHPGEQELILHYYGEADDPAALEEHFKTCAACRIAFESLQSTLNAIEPPEIPRRPETYGSDVWARLEPALLPGHRQTIEGRAHRFLWWPVATPARLALAAACLALPIAGFIIGLLWRTTPQPAATRPGLVADIVTPEQVRERILLVTVGDHLERSQMALVEFVNVEGDRDVDISSAQTWVEDLLASNRLYRQTASEEGNTAVADLLEELERVLVEIARSPSTISAAELARLHERIDERGILFKVKVLGNRIREDAQRPLTEPTS